MNKKYGWKKILGYAGLWSVLFVGILTEKPLSVRLSPTSAKEPDINQKLVAQGTYSRSNNIGVLNNTRVFSDRVSSQNQENIYFFSLDRPSNISIYLDNVTSSVRMRLYVDTNSNGVADSNESLTSDTAYSSRLAEISRTLGADNYIVVVQFGGGNSDYNLQLVNKTNEAVNVGSLKGTRTFTGSINRNTRKKYYRFSLSSPSDVRLSLDRVTNSVGIRLYVDTNGNGIIDSNESLSSATAYSSSAGVIRRRLGADNYFVIITGSGGNTNYRLTMFAP